MHQGYPPEIAILYILIRPVNEDRGYRPSEDVQLSHQKRCGDGDTESGGHGRFYIAIIEKGAECGSQYRSDQEVGYGRSPVGVHTQRDDHKSTTYGEAQGYITYNYSGKDSGKNGFMQSDVGRRA